MPNKIKDEIRVIHKDRSYTLTLVNGCLSVATLKKFFPEADGLVYTRENDNILMDFDDHGLIKIKDNVDIYGIYTVGGVEGVSGATINNSSMQRLRWLQQRKETLQEKLSQKNVELKKLCILEAELTGVVPLEIPLEAGEAPPIIHRKTGGSSLSYSENIINKLKTSDNEESALEVERQIQVDLAKNYLSILNDQSKSKAIRRKNRSLYQQAQRRIQEYDAELNFIRHSHGSGLRHTSSYISLHGSQNQLTKRRVKKPCSPLNLDGTDFNLNIDDDPDYLQNQGGITLSPVAQDQQPQQHNFNSYPKHNFSNVIQYSHHQSTVSLDQHQLKSNRKFIEDHMNVNNNLTFLPQELPPLIRNRTYSQNSADADMRNQQYQLRNQPHPHLHQHRTVPNTYSEEERQQKRRHQSLKSTPDLQAPPISPGAYQGVHNFPQPPPYSKAPQPPPPPAANQSSNSIVIKSTADNKGKSAINTYLPQGYWVRSGDEIVWCAGNDEEDYNAGAAVNSAEKFGSLDRRKNILQHSSNFGPPQSTGISGAHQHGVTRHHTVAISSKSQSSAAQQKQQHPVLAQAAMEAKFLPRKALTRTQSLGNVETWYPVQDSADLQKLTGELIKPKEKEWTETSLDVVGLPKESSVQPQQMSVRNVKRQASRHENPISPGDRSGRILTGREPVRSNSIPAHRRVRDPDRKVTKPPPPLPMEISSSSSSSSVNRMLEIPAESSKSMMDNEYDNKIIPQASPNNHTIVQLGTYQPYREQTKPFEMSDFYKYSTKFRNKNEGPRPDDRVIPSRMSTNQQSALANFALR